MAAAISTIIGSFVSATAAIIVCILNNKAQHRKIIEELNKQNELHAYRIGQLEQKMDKHNNFIERVYILEKEEAVIEEQIKVANHRIDDLEKKE